MPFLALLDPNPDPPTVSNTKKPLQNEVQFMLMGQGRIWAREGSGSIITIFFIWVLAKVWVVNEVVNG
jgi:hypothetical protein